MCVSGVRSERVLFFFSERTFVGGDAHGQPCNSGHVSVGLFWLCIRSLLARMRTSTHTLANRYLNLPPSPSFLLPTTLSRVGSKGDMRCEVHDPL